MIDSLFRNLGRLFNWFVTVAPWEQAIRVRAGKHVRLLASGLYIKIPFIDRIYRQNIRRRIAQIRPQTLTTKDNKCVTLCGSVQYSIGDILLLFKSLDQPEDTVEALVAAKIANYVANNELAECHPLTIQQKLNNEIDLEQFGLIGKEIFITSFAVVKTYRLINDELSGGYTYRALSLSEDRGAQELTI